MYVKGEVLGLKSDGTRGKRRRSSVVQLWETRAKRYGVPGVPPSGPARTVRGHFFRAMRLGLVFEDTSAGSFQLLPAMRTATRTGHSHAALRDVTLSLLGYDAQHSGRSPGAQILDEGEDA